MSAGRGRKRKRGSVSRAEKSERKRLTGVLDDLARRLCKIRDRGLCRKCGKAGLECHHIHSRRHASIRFNLLNLLSLCPVCHRFMHDDPVSARDWIAMEIGAENLDLLDRARNWPELTLGEMDALVTIYRNRLKGTIQNMP